MARVATLDKNCRVKTLVSITGDKYKNYKVILVDTFYRKIYRGDAVHCSIHGEARIKALQELILKLESRDPKDFAVTECEIGASTLTDAHDYVYKLLTLEGWHQYRAGMISGIQEEIKKEEELVNARNREDRERTSYRFDSGCWKDVIISGDGNGLFGKEDWEIKGMVGRTTKAISSNTKTVSDWKDTELKRLKETLTKLNGNIALLESLDVNEVQSWMDALKVNATEYIETGLDHEFE
jgi:hypothetical protein